MRGGGGCSRKAWRRQGRPVAGGSSEVAGAKSAQHWYRDTVTETDIHRLGRGQGHRLCHHGEAYEPVQAHGLSGTANVTFAYGCAPPAPHA
jgi:hypothetical protein